MKGTGDAAFGAVKETTVFLAQFDDLPDYRQKGKVAYPLDEVMLVMLAATLTGAETVADIARFGRAKLAFLRRFRPFANGTPSHDQLGIILAKLDPVAFQGCFVAWTAALTKTPAEVISANPPERARIPPPRLRTAQRSPPAECAGQRRGVKPECPRALSP